MVRSRSAVRIRSSAPQQQGESMKQTALSISLSIFFLVSGVVSLYQGSNPAFISNADSIVKPTFDLSVLLIVIGSIQILLSGIIVYIQYHIMKKRGK